MIFCNWFAWFTVHFRFSQSLPIVGISVALQNANINPFTYYLLVATRPYKIPLFLILFASNGG
jgi:hypothetical protein